MTDFWLSTLVPILVTTLASSGFWVLLLKFIDRKSSTTKLLLGLSRDRIIYLGMGYVERGWITKDEYDDFNHYLCEPYSQLGGNGLVDRVISEVKKIPIRKRPPNTDELKVG